MLEKQDNEYIISGLTLWFWWGKKSLTFVKNSNIH